MVDAHFSRSPVTPGAAEYWIPAFAGNDIAMILLEREPL
jgi:hypothetical protein